MKKHNILVISPTYNERENIDKFSNNILDLNFKVLIIDDNSPDGTANVISKKEGFQKNIFLISRKEKLGYGSAVIEGFNFGIDNDVRLTLPELSFSTAAIELDFIIKNYYIVYNTNKE